MKRIAIFTDGTWNSPERGGATNVLQLTRGIKPRHDNHEQVAFYDWGVGTDRKKIMGGISGAGIDKNIMDSYRFIVHNFEPGDHLFFFGFSRGAYTARSLGGFIRNCGVLKREHAAHIPEAYEMYRRRSASASPNSPKAVGFRRKYAWENITPIEFVGAWDTVGALGIPVPFWGTLEEREFLFHDTEPSKIIRHARHALAIDERREDFQPTLWDHKPDIDLLQLWFSGVHSNVGGSYEDSGLSDIALDWMVREAMKFGLGFEPHVLDRIKPDHRGRLYNSRKGVYRVRGTHVRELRGPLHESVQKRWEEDVDGYRKKCAPLKALLKAHENDWSQLDVRPSGP